MLRVVQWATGVVGQHAVRAVCEHPDLELVGARVYSDAKAGRDVGEICGIGKIGVNATNDPDEMIVEAQKYAAWSKHIVVKVPMGPAGLQAVNILKQRGIKTNVTAVMSVNQAMLAAAAGATYASIFLSRIHDIGHDGVEIIRQSAALFKQAGLATKIIVGSIRMMTQINDAAMAGAHVVTVPYKFFSQMANHPQTDKTIQEFLDAWEGTKVSL